MFTKYEVLEPLEKTFLDNGVKEEIVETAMKSLDTVYEIGFADGYKRGRQDEIISQMMGESNA